MKKNILLMAVLIFGAAQVFSQWSRQVTTDGWTSTSIDVMISMKIKDGKVYVTGNSIDNSSAVTLYSIVTIKYDAVNFGTPEWKAVYPSGGTSNKVEVKGIDVDDQGHVFIAGISDNGSNTDFLTVGYDNNGKVFGDWPVTYDDPIVHGDDRANAIGVDNLGNVYVTGASLTSHGRTNNMDINTICYNNLGSELWVRKFNARGNKEDEAFALAIDNIDGVQRHHAGVYVAGWGDEGTNCPPYESCRKDAMLVYYDPSGSNEKWMHYGCGGCEHDPNFTTGNDFIKAIVISPATGDIFCTGAKWCGESYCGIDPAGMHPDCPWQECTINTPGIPGSYEVFTARFYWITANEDPVCSACETGFPCIGVDECYCDNSRYDGPVNYGVDVGRSIVVDPTTGASHHDYVYTTGFTQQTELGGTPLNSDYITLKFNHSEGDSSEHGIKRPWCTECNPTHGEGVGCPRANCPQTYSSANDNADDYANSIAIDATGSLIYVTGRAEGLVSDIVTIGYETVNGTQVCLDRYDGSEQNSDSAVSVAVFEGTSPNQKAVFVAGLTNGSPQPANDHSDFIIIKYTGCPSGDFKKPLQQTQKLSDVPSSFSLSQNYPNPFNPTTTIKYAIPRASYVSIKIYNALGQSVMSISEKYLEPGFYSQIINASSFSSGIYFYEIKAKDASDNSVIFSDSKKMLLIK